MKGVGALAEMPCELSAHSTRIVHLRNSGARANASISGACEGARQPRCYARTCVSIQQLLFSASDQERVTSTGMTANAATYIAVLVKAIGAWHSGHAHCLACGVVEPGTHHATIADAVSACFRSIRWRWAHAAARRAPDRQGREAKFPRRLVRGVPVPRDHRPHLPVRTIVKLPRGQPRRACGMVACSRRRPLDRLRARVSARGGHRARRVLYGRTLVYEPLVVPGSL